MQLLVGERLGLIRIYRRETLDLSQMFSSVEGLGIMFFY